MRLLVRIDGLDVEVVGRHIQHQQVWSFHLDEGQSDFLSAEMDGKKPHFPQRCRCQGLLGSAQLFAPLTQASHFRELRGVYI